MQPRFYAPGNLTLVVDEVEAYINNEPAYLVKVSLSSVGRERRGQPRNNLQFGKHASKELCDTTMAPQMSFARHARVSVRPLMGCGMFCQTLCGVSRALL
jgi:hypothetical protein